MNGRLLTLLTLTLTLAFAAAGAALCTHGLTAGFGSSPRVARVTQPIVMSVYYQNADEGCADTHVVRDMHVQVFRADGSIKVVSPNLVPAAGVALLPGQSFTGSFEYTPDQDDLGPLRSRGFVEACDLFDAAMGFPSPACGAGGNIGDEVTVIQQALQARGTNGVTEISVWQPVGTVVEIESSSNMRDWLKIRSYPVRTNGVLRSDYFAGSQRFFRVRYP